ncbi:hypothetical protein C8R42DRAFT_776799 [Lentinula raphanica]|nr:hypothetical protein C8R42DRAFT_776799 [Lentinula raphanica]
MTLLTIPRFYPSKLGLLIVFFAILLDVAFTLPMNSVHSTSSDHSVHTGSVPPQPNEAPPRHHSNVPLRRIAVYVSHLDEDGYPTYWSWVRFGGDDVLEEDRRQYRSQKFSREEAERLERRQTIHDSPIVPWRRNWFYKVVNPSEFDPTIHDAIFTLVGYVVFPNQSLLDAYLGNLSPPDLQIRDLVRRRPPVSPTNPNFVKAVLKDLLARRSFVRITRALRIIVRMPWKS